MNMKRKQPGLWLAAIPIVLLGCVGKGLAGSPERSLETGQDPMQGRAKPTEEQMNAAPGIAASMNSFGFNLIGQLSPPSAKEPNLLVSPASISLNLQTVLSGADGASREGLIKALALTGKSPEEIRSGAYGLVFDLLKGEDQVLSIANSVWTIGEAKLTPAFLQNVQSAYAAEGLNVPDRSEASVQRINDWVKTNTRDRIPTIIDDLDPMAKVFLVNAIAFDGKWQDPFNKNRTQDGDFDSIAGKKVKAKFMEQNGDYMYAKTPEAELVRIPYREGRFAMILALPKPGMGVDKLLGTLSGGAWETLVGSMSSKPGLVRLPKWTLRDGFTLNSPLQALGASAAFQPSTDWLSMSPDLKPEGFIGRVIHKTYVEVDEEGTKAAAATGTEMRATSARAPEEPFRFDAKRPFVYAIQHVNTGALLFIGVCGDPTVTEMKR